MRIKFPYNVCKEKIKKMNNNEVLNQCMTAHLHWSEKGGITLKISGKRFIELVSKLKQDDNLHRVFMSDDSTDTGVIITKKFYESHPEKFDSNGDPV